MKTEMNSLRDLIEGARRVFKPRVDYREFSTPRLIIEAAKEWTTVLEIVLRIIDRPEFDQELALKTARFLAARANDPKHLALLHKRAGRWEPLASLLFHLLAAEQILGELSSRLSSPLRVGTMLAAVSAPDGRGAEYLQPFRKALKIEDLNDHYFPEDPGDLRQYGVVGALEKAEKIRKELRKVFPKPAAFIFTQELAFLPEGRRWNWPELYRDEMARVGGGLGVYFDNQVELLSGAAWQTYHDVFRKRDALKRGGPGRKPKKTKRNQAANEPIRDGGQESSIRRRVRHHEFIDEENAEASATPEQAAQVKELLRTAKAHLSDKGARYFGEFATGATQREAAAAAGITDRMARKYEANLRKLLGIVKPAKKV